MSVLPRDLVKTMSSRTRERHAADEALRRTILKTLEIAIPSLAKELDLGHVWVIGSVAWGTFGERSDVDLVLENGEESHRRAEFEARVGDMLGREVDVLALGHLGASFRRRVLSEGLRVA